MTVWSWATAGGVALAFSAAALFDGTKIKKTINSSRTDKKQGARSQGAKAAPVIAHQYHNVASPAWKLINTWRAPRKTNNLAKDIEMNSVGLFNLILVSPTEH